MQVRNDSKNAAECTLVIEDPSFGAMANPHSFTLGGNEVRTVTVAFAADARPSRSQRVSMTLRDDAGAALATFEHPLILAGSTDCSVALAWKDAIVEGGVPRGFELSCTVRSQSEGPNSFPVAFTVHPALEVPELAPISLEPGQSKDIVIAVRWNRDLQDSSGSDHPAMLEASVPVSNGRRTSRLRWETIESKLRELENPAAAIEQPEAASEYKPDVQFAWNNIIAAVQGPPQSRADSRGHLAPAESATTTEVSELPLFSALVSQLASSTPTNETQPPLEAEPISKGTEDLNTAPARWAVAHNADLEDASAVAHLADLSEPLTIASPVGTSLAARPATQSRRFAPPRAGFLIGGLAVAALVLAFVFFRPTVWTQAPSTSPVAVTASSASLVSSRARVPAGVPRSKPVARHAIAAVHKIAPSNPAPQVAVQRLTAPPARPQRRATQVSRPVAVRKLAPARQVRSERLANPQTQGAIVALGGIEAFYGPRGRAVRVVWSAAEQASAKVQLIDGRGATVNAVTVRGDRQAVTVRLPRRFHGPLTVEVSSTGRLGERVAETTSLPAFGE